MICKKLLTFKPRKKALPFFPHNLRCDEEKSKEIEGQKETENKIVSSSIFFKLWDKIIRVCLMGQGSKIQISSKSEKEKSCAVSKIIKILEQFPLLGGQNMRYNY